MSFFDKYTSMVSKRMIDGEEMFNLWELVKCIETDKTPPLMEACIMTPNYISGKGRYELYQYEFWVEEKNGETFEEYILRITGKKKMEEVPDDIISIRQKCFTKIDSDDQSVTLTKMREYFLFLMGDEIVQREIVEVFGEFDINKLFICIY